MLIRLYISSNLYKFIILSYYDIFYYSIILKKTKTKGKCKILYQTQFINMFYLMIFKYI